MDMLTEVLISALLVTGGVFALVGSIGLIKLSSLMARLHGPTKATTLGVGGCLLASMTYFAFFEGAFSIHELLVTLFLFLTAPVTANMVAKAHLHTLPETERALPETGSETGWATYNAAPTIEAEEKAIRS